MLALTFDFSALWSLIGKVHPVLVHFPVALITVAGLLELWEWRKGHGSSREGMLMLRIGALAAVVSAVAGWSFAQEHSPSQNLFLHRWGGISLATLAVVATYLSRGGFPARAYRPLVLLLAPLVGAVGHLGGELSWGEGYLLNAVKRVFIEAAVEPTAVPESPEEEHFLASVWPIFRERCIGCHGETKQKGDLRLDRKEVALGAVGIVIPGDAAQSDLIFLVRSDFEEEQMPPAEEGARLTEEQIQTLEKWINDGAAWPTGPLPTAYAPAKTPSPTNTQPPALFASIFPVAYAETPEPKLAGGNLIGGDLIGGDPAPVEQLFREVVQPIFATRCAGCHGEKKQKAKLRLDTPQIVFDPDRDPRIVVRNDPEASALFERISLPHDDFDLMPPKGDPLTVDQIAAIRTWIEGGAPWPKGSEPHAESVTPDIESGDEVAHALSDTEVAEVLFRAAIEPLLIERCSGCHGPKKSDGDFRVDVERVLRSRVSFRNPKESELYRRLTLPAGHEDHMPRKGRPLTPLEQETVWTWIQAGAPYPKGAPSEGGEGTTPVARLPAQIAAPGAVSSPVITLDADSELRVTRALAELNAVGIRAARLSLAGPGVEVSTALVGEAATDQTLLLLHGLEPALLRLDLSGSQVTNQGIESLAAFRELRVLHLGRSKIGNASLLTIASLPALEVLNLHGTGIGDPGINALHTHPTLRRIYLWQTDVTDTGVQALAAARPQLRIIRGD